MLQIIDYLQITCLIKVKWDCCFLRAELECSNLLLSYKHFLYLFKLQKFYSQYLESKYIFEKPLDVYWMNFLSVLKA